MLKQAVFIVALGLIAQPATAQVTGSSQQNSSVSGETRIQIHAKGISSDPADIATMFLNLRKSGKTTPEALAAVNALADRLTRDLVARGVPRGDISREEAPYSMGFVGNEAVPEDLPPELAEVMANPSKTATATLKLHLSDVSLLPRVRQLLAEEEALVAQSPDYSLKDDRSARDAAIADALRKARADAEAYASSLGLRVGRVVEVKDLATQSSMLDGIPAAMLKAMQRDGADSRAIVETAVRLAVDFILLPR